MLFALMALAAAQTFADPLSPAANGQVQCYAPSDHKTCASTTAYTANGDGSYTNASTILMAKKPAAVVVQLTTPVTIKAGAVCGALRREDVTGATVSVNGQPIPAEKAGPVLQGLAGAMSGVIGHEICTTFVPAGTGYVAKSTMDGKPQPDQDQKVVWVSPADGYSVAP